MIHKRHGVIMLRQDLLTQGGRGAGVAWRLLATRRRHLSGLPTPINHSRPSHVTSFYATIYFLQLECECTGWEGLGMDSNNHKLET